MENMFYIFVRTQYDDTPRAELIYWGSCGTASSSTTVHITPVSFNEFQFYLRI